MHHFTWWADCVEEWIVISPVPGSISATIPRASIGWFDWRCWWNVSTITRSAAAKAASTSPRRSLAW